MVKFSILMKRNKALTQAQFVKHHRNKHAQLFMSVQVVKQTVRRYVQEHAMDVELPGMPLRKYDGITELWFDDVQPLARCFSDAEYMERILPDEASFLDLPACDFLVSTENPVFTPGR